MTTAAKTDWYPAHIKPVRDGVYEIRYPEYDETEGEFALYRDGFWGCFRNSVEGCVGSRTGPQYLQKKSWRGLAEPSK